MELKSVSISGEFISPNYIFNSQKFRRGYYMVYSPADDYITKNHLYTSSSQSMRHIRRRSAYIILVNHNSDRQLIKLKKNLEFVIQIFQLQKRIPLILLLLATQIEYFQMTNSLIDFNFMILKHWEGLITEYVY